MTNRVWSRLPSPPSGFSDGLGLPPFQAHLLYNRGVRHADDVESFLATDELLLNDPMLLPDMDKAVARLIAGLDSGETIGIFGDFDTDGVTATALLTRALGDLGATVVPYLPDRTDEGHGLNETAVRLLSQGGVSLLVTVDCGSTSLDEVKLATSLGMDTIVTDHHSLLPTWPQACALINPKRPDSAYPYAHLTGAGMALKLAEALYSELGKPNPDHLLELAALGTVADVAPLTGENRLLVKKGLVGLNATQNPGIQALAASGGLKMGSLDTEALSFVLIPRLNAAGRLDSARTSLDLLTSETLEDALPLAEQLERRNHERRALTDRGIAEARGQVENAVAKTGSVPKMIMVRSGDWVPGILGLIAGRLADNYHRPAVAVGLDGEVSRGSARSTPEFNVVSALGASEDLFIRFGGHPRAAGFTIPTDSLPALQESLTALAEEQLAQVDLTPKIAIDCEISPALLAGDRFEFVQSLSPFGEGNPAPVFLTRNALVVESRQVGRDRSHLKLRLAHSGSVWDAIAFRQGDAMELAHGKIDVVYTAGLDNWGGRARLQLTVLDFRAAR